MARDLIDQLQTDWEQERPDLDAELMGVVLRRQLEEKIATLDFTDNAAVPM
ncbi:MAG: hypothetical protein HKN57_06920 [Xanthomonadales bacterium]|nr:hypothetical protein [Gammaproteobacteria bacterium]MBT8054025.1 hypothetical protein [Gammaproteobacteria bacterium]NND56965.1 hypothetical protein [Xanthomonadales bacterium]NNK51923.1 hypothetical protein [Xanthomonadales bacterium]